MKTIERPKDSKKQDGEETSKETEYVEILQINFSYITMVAGTALHTTLSRF